MKSTDKNLAHHFYNRHFQKTHTLYMYTYVYMYVCVHYINAFNGTHTNSVRNLRRSDENHTFISIMYT